MKLSILDSHCAPASTSPSAKLQLCAGTPLSAEVYSQHIVFPLASDLERAVLVSTLTIENTIGTRLHDLCYALTRVASRAYFHVL